MKNFQNKTKIVKVSKVLRNFLRIGLFLWVFSVLGFFTAFLIPIFVSSRTHGNLHLDSQKIYLMCGTVLSATLGFIVNLKLFRFFDRLKDGHLFDTQSVGNLDAAGKWWIVFWLYQGLFSEIGNQFFQSKMVWDSGGLFAALTLIFVAWLLKEAQELQEEQELTV
jgi:ABC-type Fe3+-siderophore transport system permease subunit